MFMLANEMDGEAVEAAFAAIPGPDCFKDLIPKLGLRLKVYNEIKALFLDEVIQVCVCVNCVCLC